MEISAAMVKALRDKTGLSMMECKKALAEGSGDEAAAIDILRKRGLSKANEMATREASQGRIACFVDAAGQKAGMVELRCETAPVASTTDFIDLSKLLARTVAAMQNPTPESLPEQPIADAPGRKIADAIHDAFNRLRENMKISRVVRLSGHVGHYLHHNGQVGVLIEMSGSCPESVMADVCMHIAAMRPMYLKREDVSPELVAKEREIAREQVKDKPANIIEKIVDGKINTWYGEVCLLEQAFVKAEGKQTVQAFLSAASKGLTVNRYARFEVGGA